jgi:hypothetical protein
MIPNARIPISEHWKAMELKILKSRKTSGRAILILIELPA